jgi:hypothetical protein
MTMIRIRFKEEQQEAEAVVELARRGRVYCLLGGLYEVPARSLAVLDQLAIPYEVVRTEGFDSLIQTLQVM